MQIFGFIGGRPITQEDLDKNPKLKELHDFITNLWSSEQQTNIQEGQIIPMTQSQVEKEFDINFESEEDDCMCENCQQRRYFEANGSLDGFVLESVFETEERFTFDMALGFLKSGKIMCRGNWEEPRQIHYIEEGEQEGVRFLASFVMEVQENVIIPYTPTTEDILADDWLILKDKE